MAVTTASVLFSTTAAALTTTQIIVGGLVFLGVSTAITSALVPKPKMPDMSSVGGNISVSIDSTGASEIIYGQIRKGGIKTYHETTGNNKFYHYFLTLAMHEVEEIGNIYINDQVVTLDSNGYVTSNDWNSKILIKKFTGASNQNIYTSLNGLTNKPEKIDSTFKGQGVACIYVRMEYDPDVFQNGQPLVTAVVKGKKLYDPRKDGTSSAYDSSLGVNSHRLSNPSTWQYSSNPALAIRDYLTFYQGVNADNSQIDDDMIAQAANDCASVGSYTESSFEIGGSLSTGNPKIRNLNDLIQTLNGTLFWAQGKFRLLAGAYRSPTIADAFTLDDVRSEIQVQTRYSRRDLVNTVRGTFNDKDNRWIATEFPEISLVDMSEDNDVESVIDLELPLVTKSAAAQRLAKQILYTSREQITLSAKFSAKAYQLQIGDVIKLTISRYGWVDKEFMVKAWKATGGDGTPVEVQLTLQETSSVAYQWNITADEYQAITSNNTFLDKISDNLQPSNITALPSVVLHPDGTVNSRLAVSWDAPTNPNAIRYEVQWKTSSDVEYNETTTSTETILLTNLVAGATYAIRIRSVSIRGNKSPWTSASFDASGDSLAPSPPTFVSEDNVKIGAYRTITISWTPPLTNTDETTLKDLAGYEIYRSTTNSIPSSFSYRSSANKITDGGLTDDTTYYYWIKAYDWSGNTSTALSIGSITTLPELVDGADGASVVIVYADDSSGTNKTFTYSNQEYILYFEYTGDVPSIGNITGTWVKFKGDDGSNVYPIYSSVADPTSSSQLSFTAGTNDYVTFYESVTQPTLASVFAANPTFVKFVGDDGAQGGRGAGRWDISLTNAQFNNVDQSSDGDTYVDSYFTSNIGEPVDKDQAWFRKSDGSQAVWIYSETGNSWSFQTEIIDGDLLVDGTVTTDKIVANAITSEKLQVSANQSDIYSTVPTSTSSGTVKSTASGLFFNGTHNRIEIWESGKLRVLIGKTTYTPSNA